jgi:hypothetical protein
LSVYIVFNLFVKRKPPIYPDFTGAIYDIFSVEVSFIGNSNSECLTELCNHCCKVISYLVNGKVTSGTPANKLVSDISLVKNVLQVYNQFPIIRGRAREDWILEEAPVRGRKVLLPVGAVLHSTLALDSDSDVTARSKLKRKLREFRKGQEDWYMLCRSRRIKRGCLFCQSDAENLRVALLKSEQEATQKGSGCVVDRVSLHKPKGAPAGSGPHPCIAPVLRAAGPRI